MLCECALHRFRQKPPNWTLLIKVSFKFILALKQWLVCTIFSATILLHLRSHSSKIYSLIFLHVSILIFPIISPTNTPRVRNQFIRSTLQFLHFILTLQLTFPNYFFISFFYATQNFLPQRRALDIQQGRRTRTTDDPREREREREPERPTL